MIVTHQFPEAFHIMSIDAIDEGVNRLLDRHKKLSADYADFTDWQEKIMCFCNLRNV